MKRTTLLKIVAGLALAVAASAPARADCSADKSTKDKPTKEKFTKEIVPYYTKSYPLPPLAKRDETAESICDISSKNGQRICNIKLWGVLYTPKSDKIFAQFPALIFNHGSGEGFDTTMFCELGEYFAEMGYLVLIPFRRGQGGPPKYKSTGIYIEDLATDFENDTTRHNTTCLTTACYRAEILRLQADEEVVFSLDYLKLRDSVKKDSDGNQIFGVGGNSYGGAVTVFFNRKDHGQRAVLAFAPAAQLWGQVTFAYAAAEWEPKRQRNPQEELLKAAKNATQPAYYLQAKWDYDTRPTIDLAYAHAYGSDDPTHGQRFMAAIFPYPKPGMKKGEIDYQEAHWNFIRDPQLWGPSVVEFLKLHGVQ